MLIPFLIHIIAAPCLALLLQDAYQWQYRFGGLLNRKPFNCFTCLSAWLALTLSVLPADIADPVSAFAIAGMLAFYIENIL